MGSSFSRPRALGVHEQAAFIRQRWPMFICRVRSGFLVCHGVLQPDPLCSEYRVRIEYRVGSRPRVFVEAPELADRSSSEPVPHAYGPGEPCLFVPGSSEWRPDKILAFTVVGWLSAWLLFYEVWRATGEWLGEGVHPPRKVDPRRREPTMQREGRGER
jgi:hypothetical protein